MSVPVPIAHSKNTAGATHELRAHLTDVAAKATEFAAEFGSADWGRAVGLLHDLGKSASDFQAKIAADPDAGIEARGQVDHSSAGAIYALRHEREVNLPAP